MSNKKAYLVLTHTFAPAPGADTSMKNFGDEGQWQMHESVYFVTRIRKGWWQTEWPSRKTASTQPQR